MMTPYDWQEAVNQRADFVATRLTSGVPVVCVSVQEGIVAATFRKNVPKLYEIYDRLLYSAIGLQSDVESLRVSALEFAHREGYQRSEQDVSIQRVVLSLSQPIKQSFSDFRTAPMIAKGLFAEVGATIDEDLYYVIDYDGDYAQERKYVVLAGKDDIGKELVEAAKSIEYETESVNQVLARVQPILQKSLESLDNSEPFTFEAALVKRGPGIERRLKRLTD